MKRRFQNLPVTIQLIVLIALGLTPAAGFFVFGVPGVMDSVHGLARRADILENRARRLNAENAHLEAFRDRQVDYLRQIDALRRKLETLWTIVPDEPATDRFLRTVSEAARGAGVRIFSLDARPFVWKDFYAEVPFSAKVDGTFLALQSFFERLRRLDRITSVTGLSIGPPEGRVAANNQLGPGATVRATCVLTIYFNRPSPPSAPARAR